MLVFKRKPGQEVILADGSIVVRVVEITREWVRLGFTAPDSVTIHRREVFDAIARKQGETP